MIKPITVLSLFDGISCGRLALQRAGIPLEKYYACEIKDIAIKIAKDNFPDNIYLGDVTKVDFTQFRDKIDLVIGGSPCQDCSQANPSRLGLDGPKSSLFFYYAKAVKDTNAKYFFLENVDMPGKDLETISKTLGTYPININSSLFSAQQRSRNYWFNFGNKQYDLWGFPTCDIPVPKDKGITLQSILESGYADKEKQWCLLRRSYISQKNSCDRVLKGRYDRSMLPCAFKDPDCKWESFRWHTQTELERLQTLPDGYTKSVDLWDASDCIGDGWTVDVIAYIFCFLKENLEKDLKN